MQGINLLKNDYERYVFPISLVNTVGRKKNRYITSELEQRHPCFSDNFCFDDLLKISKKGLVSDVIVIDKSKLAEYRRKTKWWISFFRTEDTGRICFVSEKTKMIFIILFLVLVSSAFITVSFAGKKINGEEEKIEADIPVIQEISEPEKIPAGFYGKSFIDSVASGNGSITSIDWLIDGFEEKVSASVLNIYPEQILLPFINVSAVVYKDGKPEFNVTAAQKIEVRQGKTAADKTENFPSGIREIISNAKLKIEEEHYSPYSISFSAKNDFSCFLKIEDLCKTCNVGITKILISGLEKESVKVQIKFTENFDYANGIPISYLQENKAVFPFEINYPVKNKSVSKTSVNIPKDSDEKNLVKIGAVKYENGKTVLFYKDKEGKLIKKWEE